VTTQRYHKIAEEPKINYDLAEPERHRYSELDVVNEALRELLSQLYSERSGYLCKDKAHVALKILYRLEEHHKMARDGRPDYPPFSWEMVKHFATTPPFTYIEYSTPLAGGGKRPGQPACIPNSGEAFSPREPSQAAPAPPQEDTA